MKTLSFVLAILISCAAALPAGADTCLKQKRHMDEYYYGGTITPEENTDIEVWLGGKKMAYITPTQYIVVDLGNNALLFGNKRDSTYVETKLPFDWNDVLDEGTAEMLAQYRTEGVVKESGEARNIQGHNCKGYLVETWIESPEGERFNERIETVWMTTGLAIDWEAYGKIGENAMKLQNYDEALVAAFSAFEGYPLLIDSDVYMKGFSVKSVEETVEIIEAQPETDVYSLPTYFTRKDKLTMADLRG